MKTTRELREAHAELSHDMLKNEILHHLADPGRKHLLGSNEAPVIRAKTLAEDFRLGRVDRKNIVHAAGAWRTEQIAKRVVDFLAAAREWDDFRPNAQFEAACMLVTNQLATLTSVFIRLAASSAQLTQEEAIGFFTSLLTLWDFIRGLDERSPKFHLYMVSA